MQKMSTDLLEDIAVKTPVSVWKFPALTIAFSHWHYRRDLYQSINQSVNQSVSQSVSQSIYQSIHVYMQMKVEGQVKAPAKLFPSPNSLNTRS